MCYRYLTLSLKKAGNIFFALKLRFCLFCLEHILFIKPPLNELKKDLQTVKESNWKGGKNWATKTYRRYFS